MATPLTGPISMSQIRAEAGLTGPISFSNIHVKRMAMDLLGSNSDLSRPVKMSNARGTQYFPPGDKSNIWLSGWYGSLVAATYKLVIAPGARVLGHPGNNALTVGQFPSGSVINIVNFGQILGHGGSIGQGATGGYGQPGGSCINADFSNQYTNLFNKPGGQVLGGGGGGGKGGVGGTGGRGGSGYYIATGQEGPYRSGQDTGVFRYVNGVTYWKWHQGGNNTQNFFSTAGDGVNQVNVGGDRYYRHVASGGLEIGVGGYFQSYEIYRQWDYQVWSGGGWGGGGGGGGDGGWGQGWNVAQSGPTQGGLAGGAGGSGPGGPGAGWGGTGGRGGDGAWGGGWGANGNTGATGWTGGTGGAGNGEGGGAGTGGSGGYSGGAGGYWGIFRGKGATSNEGQLLGNYAP